MQGWRRIHTPPVQPFIYHTLGRGGARRLVKLSEIENKESEKSEKTQILNIVYKYRKLILKDIQRNYHKKFDYLLYAKIFI